MSDSPENEFRKAVQASHHLDIREAFDGMISALGRMVVVTPRKPRKRHPVRSQPAASTAVGFAAEPEGCTCAASPMPPCGWCEQKASEQ